MNWILKKLLLLVITLAVSTAAAKFVRQFVLFCSGKMVIGDQPIPSGQQLPDAPVKIIYLPNQCPPSVTGLQTGRMPLIIKLRMMLNRDGTVSNVTPVETSVVATETQRAVEYAKQMQFSPAIVGGQYVDTEQLVEICPLGGQ